MSESVFAQPWYQQAFGIEELVRAAQLEHPYSVRMGGESQVHTLHAASVLILFSPNGREILLTKRTETVDTHKGQFAFPGGRLERGETPEQAALRESFEEVGVLAQDVRIAGALPELLTVTGYRVTPFLGMLARPTSEVILAPQPEETAEIFWAAVSDLFQPEAYRREKIEHGGILYPIEAFYLGDRRIWGATAAMLGNTAARLKEILR